MFDLKLVLRLKLKRSMLLNLARMGAYDSSSPRLNFQQEFRSVFISLLHFRTSVEPLTNLK